MGCLGGLCSGGGSEKRTPQSTARNVYASTGATRRSIPDQEPEDANVVFKDPKHYLHPEGRDRIEDEDSFGEIIRAAVPKVTRLRRSLAKITKLSNSDIRGKKLAEKVLTEYCNGHGIAKNARSTKVNHDDSEFSERIEMVERYRAELARAAQDPNGDEIYDRVANNLIKRARLESKRCSWTMRYISQVLIGGGIELQAKKYQYRPSGRDWHEFVLDREICRAPDTVDRDQVADFLAKIFHSGDSGRAAFSTIASAFENRDLSIVGDVIKTLPHFKQDTLAIQSVENSRKLWHSDGDDDDDDDDKDFIERSKSRLRQLHLMLAAGQIIRVKNGGWTTPDGGIYVAKPADPGVDTNSAYDQEELTIVDADFVHWNTLGGVLCAALGTAAEEIYSRYWNTGTETKFSSSSTCIAARLEDLYKRRFFMKSADPYQPADLIPPAVAWLSSYIIDLEPEVLQQAIDGPKQLLTSDFAQANPREPNVSWDQELLQTIVADATAHQLLHQPLAVLHAEFESFNNSISHAAVIKLLEFFNLSAEMIEEMKVYMSVPFRFGDGSIERFDRGLPIRLDPSRFLSELMLFVLDFAFNRASGLNLYRRNGSVWAWGDPNKVAMGWATINEFASVMGLRMDPENTGCVSTVPLEGLPRGPVRHKLLCLGDDFKFRVDPILFGNRMAVVKSFVDFFEGLDKSVSVTSLLTSRILKDCLQPSTALGTEHTESIIHAFKTQPIDPANPDNLKLLARGITDPCFLGHLRPCLWYWPMNFGGLELFNPVIDLMQARDSLASNSINPAIDFAELETEYQQLAAAASGQQEPLPPFDEYLKNMWFDESSGVSSVFDLLLADPRESPELLEPSPIDQVVESAYFDTDNHIRWSIKGMSPYWDNIVSMYGPEMKKSYGSEQVFLAGEIAMGVPKLLNRDPKICSAQYLM